MTFSMFNASVPVFEVSLRALCKVLEKGEAFAVAKKIDPTILLQMRLAPDMFPLVRQVQIATDLAKNGLARLASTEPPRFEDSESTIGELTSRVVKTIDFLKSLDRKQIESSSDREILFPLGPAKKGEMKGADYLSHYIIPNVNFHCAAAYLILRHCGVEVGKLDYLGAIPIKIS
jgi:hypothetical protein